MRSGAIARTSLILLAAAAATACATAGTPAGAAHGYIGAAAVAELADALPSPTLGAPLPTPVVSMDRWWLAIVHAEMSPPLVAQHFDCALGARLLAKPRPALTRVMSRLGVDLQAAVAHAGRRTFIPRPTQADPDLRPCQRVTEAQRTANAWPAIGGATGAAYGELVASLAPDRAEAARRAGAALGESRVICGMNGPDDVADGRALGLAVYARAAQSPTFQSDLAEARLEIAAARAEGLTSPGCAAERRAYGDPAWGLRPDAG